MHKFVKEMHIQTDVIEMQKNRDEMHLPGA